MPRKPHHVVLRGGLDLVSSPLTVDGGRLWGCLNYEPVEAGYRRLRGYERFDGRPQPSEADYWILRYEAGSALGLGQVVTPQAVHTPNMAASATLLRVVGDDGGPADATGYFVLSEIVGDIADGNQIQIPPSNVGLGNADDTPARLGADTLDLDLEYRDLGGFRESTLANIAVVPGSGVVRGVWYFGNALYAFRDNATETAGGMYKASAAGWAAVDLGHRVGFDAGVTRPTVGATLTGGTTGATARLGAIVLDDATVDLEAAWDGTLEGTFWLTGLTGVFQDNEALQVSGATVATADGVAAANTLPAGGRYDFRNHNFYGQVATREMYGVNGAGSGVPLRRYAIRRHHDQATG